MTSKSLSDSAAKTRRSGSSYVATAGLALALASPALAQTAPSTEIKDAADVRERPIAAVSDANVASDSRPQATLPGPGASSGSEAQDTGVGGSTASTGPTSSGQLGDIIVTANRRDETVQKAALAIQAFSAETIRTEGVTQAKDLSKLVQGLQIGVIGSTTQIYIRGIGDNSANPLSNPGVAFNVDGVYVGRPEAVTSNFYDISRIEALKGPQGTLYGRNASGGAINLVTNSPDFAGLHGSFDASIGNYDLFRIEAAANVPLGSTLAARIAVNRVKRDGYLTDGTADDDQFAGRIKLLYKPSDDLSLLLTGDAARVRGAGGGWVFRPKRPGGSNWEGSTDPRANAYVAASFNRLLPPGGTDSFVHNNYYNASAQLDVNLGFANLTVIPAYRRTEIATRSYNASRITFTSTADQYTGEVRLANSTPGLKWVAGFYAFREVNPGTIRTEKGPYVNATLPYEPKGTAFAGFGETSIGVFDRARLILGARYTSEKRTLTGTFTSNLTNPPTLLETFFGNKTFRSFTWKAGAEYDISPTSLLFITAGTGFKAGGITQTVPPDNIYQPEKVLAFEVGSKNRFLDNRLQVNLEGYYWKLTDQQNAFLFFDSLGVNNLTVINAGKGRIYGFNLDVVAKPTSNDTLHGAVEYANSEYTEFQYKLPIFAYSPVTNGCRSLGRAPGTSPIPLLTIDCSGYSFPHAARWSGTADYTHTFDLSSGGAVDASVSGRFSAPLWLGIDFIQASRAPSFAILNAFVTYRSPQRNYSLTAFVRNINNGVELAGGQQPSFANGLYSASISPPRTYGVQLHLNW